MNTCKMKNKNNTDEIKKETKIKTRKLKYQKTM